MKLNKIYSIIFIIVFILTTSIFILKKNHYLITDNERTLSGTDSDSNGIRDDVQIWIDKEYSKSAKLKAAYNQYAVVQQNFMKAVENNTLSAKLLQDKYDALDCLSFLQPDRLSTDIVLELNLITLNTPARLDASQKEWELIEGVDNSVKISELSNKCSESIKSTEW